MSERVRNRRLMVSEWVPGCWIVLVLADSADRDWHTDVIETGLGRYRTEGEAVMAALEIAERLGIPGPPR